MDNAESNADYCECGCGKKPAPGNRFLRGHGGRMAAKQVAREAARKRREEIRREAESHLGRKLIHGECFCGCGQPTKPSQGTHAAKGLIIREPGLFLQGHGSRGRRLNKDPDYVVNDAGCWIWQKARKSTGYGHLGIAARSVPAHRWYYEQANGPIPEGTEVHHLCEVKLCVNPAHLEPLTRAEHMRRDGRAVKGQAPRMRAA